MIAEILEAERDWADIVFLVALILAAVATIMAAARRGFETAAGWAAVGFIAWGLLAL